MKVTKLRPPTRAQGWAAVPPMRLRQVIVLGLCWWCGSIASALGAELSVVGLRCEYLAEPLGIDEPAPRLSWQLAYAEAEPSAAAPLPRGIAQTAWQLLVASSPERLNSNTGDLWDSGKVAGECSTQIVYAGRPLASRQRCYWKVRVWTRQGEEAAAQPTPWSRPATWSMGLLRASDWAGQWLGSPSAAPVQPAPLLRKRFSVERPLARATLSICGLGFYELHLNGQKVGDHVLDPKFTRYDRRALYTTYDVTAQLQRGSNALGVVLGNGWYNYHVKNPWALDAAPWRGQPRLLLQLDLTFADGTTSAVVSDASWKYSPGPIQFDGILNGEAYDARLEQPGWDTAGFDDTGWVSAKVRPAPQGQLRAQMVHPIRVTEVLKPVKVREVKPGVYVYELPRNVAGTAQITARGPAGTKIKLQYAELRHPDGSLNPINIRCWCQSGEFQTDTFILQGRGAETWHARFMYHGFQYVQVTGFPGVPTLEDLQVLVMHTDFPEAGEFACSNELLNRLQQVVRWTYLNNFYGYPTDCPNREKLGWTADAHVACQTGLYNFDTAASYFQWLRDFPDVQSPEGALPGIVPTGGYGFMWGPAWDAAYFLIPWYLYQYQGDTRVLAEHFEPMKRYVDFLTSRKATNGIVAFGFDDWDPAKVHTSAQVTSTAYYYVAADIVARSARLLGREADAAKYAQRTAEIRAAYRREFIGPQARQAAAGRTQTALACNLYQGLAEPAEVEPMVQQLVANVAGEKYHLAGGILGAKYVLHTLADHGRVDTAYQVVAQTNAPGWGAWLARGATTLWELWEGGYGTRDHIMYGDVSAWCFDALAGIRPDPQAPGFKQFLIRPGFGAELSWVRATHQSPYGPISSAWKRADGQLELSVSIPPNTAATVYLPAANPEAVTESGCPAGKSPGVQFLRLADSCALFRVGSGRYTFSTAAPDAVANRVPQKR